MTELEAIQMSYEGLVEAGRAAREYVDDYQWSEGDLALQVEHLSGNERPRDEAGNFLAGESALKQYADDIEVNFSTLKDYRHVAKQWPRGTRRAASWRVHRELAPVTDRFAHIRDDMTAREAHELSKTLRGIGASTGTHIPGWFELLGIVGDTLTKADKQLAKAEDAIEAPREELIAKAYEYASWADGLAARLRAIAEA